MLLDLSDQPVSKAVRTTFTPFASDTGKLSLWLVLLMLPLTLRAQTPDGAAPRLQAEVYGPTAIWATLSHTERPLDPDAYRLTDGNGNVVEIAHVLPNTASKTLIVPRQNINPRAVYYLEVPGLGLRALCRRDPWFRTLYSDKELGAHISADGSQTTFRLFAPRAERVELYLYFKSDDPPENAASVIVMDRDEQGVWETIQEGSFQGIYYDYRLYGTAGPGDAFFDETGQHVTDPYARVSLDSFGRARVWERTTPASPLAGGIPRMEDVIAYEVHVQDFTDLLPTRTTHKGTFTGMATTGLTNGLGKPVGFDYLVNLGINVVHLMPVQEFLHYPDAEWREAFQDDPFMIEHGINTENYQWGYRTTHAFAVESRYREKDTEHGSEREQFRNLVQAFHDAGIAVLIDVVPNHTGESMDGRNYIFTFNGIDRAYYYRTDDDLNHIGPFGNEIKTEDRPMVQRWIIDQLKHFVDEFGVDGFRIDLAGQIDEQTLKLIRHELGPDILIYGEPWIAPSDPDVASNPDWAWYKADAPITFFQDDARNAFKGPVSNPENKATDRGYAGGDGSRRDAVMKGLLNSFPEEIDPNRGINYLDIHDNWTLADRFAKAGWDGRQGVEQGPFKVAAGLLFTSLGPIVLHGGTEIMRSKGSAPLAETVKRTASGEIHFHGKRDTYNMRRPNQFIWDNVGRNDSTGTGNDYLNMMQYWRGLIAFRKSAYGQVFRIGEAPPEGYYHWILPANERQLGYLVDEKVLALVNTDATEGSFEQVALPEGTWRLIANGDAVDHSRGVPGSDALLQGGQALDFTVPATSLKIWIKE